MMPYSYYDIATDAAQKTLVVQGGWVMANAKGINEGVRRLPRDIAVIDARDAERVDLWGLMKLRTLADDRGALLELNDDQKRIADFLPAQKTKLPAPDTSSGFTRLFESWGKASIDAAQTARGMMVFTGQIAVVFARAIINPRSFRFHSIVRHIEETGIRALPIIGLLAILISMVIAYQAATQLQRFGASIFTVDLTVISILREMGVLITAIMVAGRSGSAFAAEIGVMKLREEVDALKTMGFNPIEILVLPRLIAMMITLPILAFIADIMGLAGGGLISILLLDIPLTQYIDRVAMVATPTMFFVGLIKAPVFAFVITLVGTYQGMNVRGSAESVGRLTTVAVVQSIFLVIMFDALFSILFSKVGI